MANQPNTGHVKNVAGFEFLITFCTAYGAAYKPSREALQLTHLNTVLESAKAALAECKTREIAYDNVVDARIMAFKNVRKLATQVYNALVVSGVSPKIVDAAKTINRKVQGSRPTKADDAEGRTVSSSKQGFDERVDQLSALVELVKTQPEYQPNEDALKVESLTAVLTQLRQANGSVAAPYTAWSSSRIRRDDLLYAPDTGLVDLALAVKNYVKSVYGAKSPEYGQVKGIPFRRIS